MELPITADADGRPPSRVPSASRSPSRSDIPPGRCRSIGEDNLPDPWSNPQIQLLQKAFNPVATVDTAFKLSNGAGQWPVAPSVMPAGAPTRTLTVFNDTFTGTRLDVKWSLRQGAPDLEHQGRGLSAAGGGWGYTSVPTVAHVAILWHLP